MGSGQVGWSIQLRHLEGQDPGSLDKNRIKGYALKTVVVPVDVDPLKKYEEA